MHKKKPEESSKATLLAVQKEMAKPRLSKSARAQQANQATSQLPTKP